MDEPASQAKGTLLRAPGSPQGRADMEVMRSAVTIEDPNQPHCGDHAYFHADCATCQRARANFLPYPVRPGKPVLRSFGFKDDLTEAKLRALNPSATNLYADDPEFSLSLSAIRFLMRLIWPF